MAGESHQGAAKEAIYSTRFVTLQKPGADLNAWGKDNRDPDKQVGYLSRFRGVIPADYLECDARVKLDDSNLIFKFMRDKQGRVTKVVVWNDKYFVSPMNGCISYQHAKADILDVTCALNDSSEGYVIFKRKPADATLEDLAVSMANSKIVVDLVELARESTCAQKQEPEASSYQSGQSQNAQTE